MVHPDSQELDRERSPVPEGYTPYTYEFRGRHGKMQRERLFLKNTPIITESEVEQARIEPERRECLHITLNTQGGKTMKAATSAMNLGRDRLALVVQGKIKSAPVVQAVISRTFEISGLDGKNEASGLAELLNRQAPTEKNPPFISQDLALYAVHPESRRLVEEGVLRVPGFRLWKLPAHRQEKTGEEEYLFLGNSPIISGDCARHAEPDMEHPGSLDITWNEEAFRKLERASAGLRPGKDRIAVVLRGTILSTPLFQGMPSRTMLSSEDYKLIEEAARRDNMTVEEWAEATLIKDAQKRMKNYYDDSSLPEDVSLAAEVPEEYGAPRRSGPSSSPPSSARRKPRQ